MTRLTPHPPSLSHSGETGVVTNGRLFPLIVALFVVALIAYTLPWVTGSGAAMTYGAYDFAEWTSLHPASHAQTPTLLTPLLLRLPLALLALALAFGASDHASMRRRLLLGILVILTAIALFPPLEFITVARDDPNFRQQGLLAAVTLIVGLVGVGGLVRRYSGWIGAVLAVLAAISGLVGLAQGLTLLQGFAVPASIGLPGPLFALACAALAFTLSRDTAMTRAGK